MRGAKPKPTVLKLITGNPGRRPLNAQEAKPEVKIPEPPEILTGEALREWQRITPLLAEVGLITLLDRAIISAYCKSWARWIECERMLETTGDTTASPNGYLMMSTYLAISKQAVLQMCRLSEQIGLSGSARSRIKASDPPGQADPAEAFLRGKNSA
jgi:P27 family predicted phage terminase small subunit